MNTLCPVWVPFATLRARRDYVAMGGSVHAESTPADSEEEEGNQPPQSSGARLRGMIGGVGWGAWV